MQLISSEIDWKEL